MVKDTIKKCSKFFNIACTIEETLFQDFRTLVTRQRGVYVLVSDTDEIIYVGKGFIKTRQKSHWDKSVNEVDSLRYIPNGWRWLRENFEVTPDAWRLYHIELTKETELSAMEGALIHLLQPLANDETFKDRELLESNG